jgi:hypothetical protein
MQSKQLTDYVSVHVGTYKMMICITLSKKKNAKLVTVIYTIIFLWYQNEHKSPSSMPKIQITHSSQISSKQLTDSVNL